MMSSEEDTECFGLYGDKLLKKAKRTRQRVDAGEPRNSYSSIPNFSSRPSFLSGGLYGALFNNQQQPQELSPTSQHFSGLFNDSAPNNQGAFNNFAPSKMLNELLGRQMKAADAASSVDINMIGSAMDSSSGVNVNGSDTKQPMLNGTNNFESTMLSRNNESDSNQALVDNANMLRDILQGRKKEILALEQELRAVSGGDTTCPNNNNNEIKSNCDEVESSGAVATGSPPNSPHQERVETSEPEEEEEEIDDDDGNSDASESGKQSQNNVAQKQSEIIMENDNSDSYHSDLSRGSNTSLVHIKEEDMMLDDDINPNNSSQNSNKDSKPSESVEVKRARVENIVSSMRSSPSLPVQVNGCKKRKLYHPQQHESARYGGHILDDDEDEPPALKQKRVEKDVLKTQLRTMQEQLAEMQQKYVQLCNRMELESDCQDENTGDMSMELASASAIAAAAAAAAQAEELLEKSSSAGTPTNPAAAAAAAAAMYLGVGHKMFLEQEAQRLKEAVGGDHPHHPHHHHPGGQGPQSGGPPPQGHHHPCPPPHHHHHPSSHQLAVAAAAAAKNAEFSERFQFFRNAPAAISGSDLEGLAEILKTEISASLTILIDSILSRFIQQRRFMGKHQSDVATEQLNKDLLLASQLLDRKSPRTKPPKPPTMNASNPTSAAMPVMNGASNAVGGPASSALYSMGSLAGSNPFCHMNNTDNSTPQPSPQQRERADRELPEQNEALSLVVTTKKKRHKVTDTRITPRTVSRILSQDNSGPPPPGTPNSSGAITPGPGNVGSMMDPKYGSMVPSTSVGTSVHNSEPRGMMSSGSSVNECTSPRPYHPPPPPMLPVSLPTSVAIPNPGLHESQVFSPYSPFYGQHQSSSPPDRRDAESPISHPPTLLHPALLAAHANPDFGHMRSATGGSQGHVDTGDRGLDCNSADSPFDGMQPALSFSNSRWLPFSAAGRLTSPVRDSGKKSIRDYLSLLKQESMGSMNEPYSATLTPMHLRKAKLMFFWVRYPSSAVLKMYFPDIKFNKNNTAQLVKWFSNFREFYYIQMEKYARQAITEGLKNADDIHVTGDSEIYRVLNLHYNRNNHIEVWGPQVPSNFRYVIEQTLREFYKAIQTGKDTEQSWKKSIYKVISRLDDPVPEYFKSPNFLEQLE